MKLTSICEDQQVSMSKLASLSRDCSNFINDPKLILRGMKGNHYDMIHMHTQRQDRAPLDSDALASALFNFAFHERFGIKNVRMRSAFATIDVMQAMRYGQIRWIFPTNGSRIFHSTAYSDTIALLDNLREYIMFSVAPANDLIQQGMKLYDQDIITHLLEHCHEDDKDSLDECIGRAREMISTYKEFDPTDKKVGELMIVCERYYSVSADLPMYLDLIEPDEGRPTTNNLFYRLIKKIRAIQ